MVLLLLHTAHPPLRQSLINQPLAIIINNPIKSEYLLISFFPASFHNNQTPRAVTKGEGDQLTERLPFLALVGKESTL